MLIIQVQLQKTLTISSSVTDIGKSEMEKTHGLSRRAKSLFFVGWILVCVGAIANEWVLAKTFSSNGTLQFETRVIIWFFDLTLILAGSLLINSRKLTHLTRVTLALGQSYPRTLSLGIGVVTAILHYSGPKRHSLLSIITNNVRHPG